MSTPLPINNHGGNLNTLYGAPDPRVSTGGFDWTGAGAAGLGAAGSLLGSYMQMRSANNATAAGAKSTAEALAFEREREARRRAMYLAQMDAYNALRGALAARLGISLDGDQTISGLLGDR